MKKREDIERGFFTRRDFLRISGLTTGGVVLGSWGDTRLSFANDVYPARDITFVVPSKPGASHDLIARGITPFISQYLKEVSPEAKGGGIQIRNEAAGAGQKGYYMLFKGKSDGYMIGGIDTSVITDSIVEKSEIDFKKLTFLACVAHTTKVLVTSKKGFKNWDEAVTAMKKGPVKLSVASFAGSNHVAAIVLNEKANTNFRIINYPGAAEAQNAVLRGDVQAGIVSETSAGGLIEAGEARVLLELTDSAVYPGAVSLKEYGFPELVNKMTSQHYIVAPPNLAEEPRNILIEAIKKATNDKEFEALTKRAKFNLGKTYGKEAGEKFLEFAKYYESIEPLLMKHLK